MENNERYAAAKKHAGEIRGFYGHLTTYVGVIVLLFIIDLVTGDDWWVYWPAIGWGIGVTVHAISVFGNPWGNDWEERKIKELIDKDTKMGERRAP